MGKGAEGREYLIQDYLLIPLDIFLKKPHNISSKLDAWLCLIASDQPRDIQKVLEAYPEFAEVYREVFAFRFKPKEMMSMFSDALRILDANTTQYMIEIQQEEISRLKEELEKEQQERQIQLEERQRQLEEGRKRMQEQEDEIRRLRDLLAQKNQ